jgi:hypothetical protein
MKVCSTFMLIWIFFFLSSETSNGRIVFFVLRENHRLAHFRQSERAGEIAKAQGRRRPVCHVIYRGGCRRIAGRGMRLAATGTSMGICHGGMRCAKFGASQNPGFRRVYL